jgi:hypothetical protein
VKHGSSMLWLREDDDMNPKKITCTYVCVATSTWMLAMNWLPMV